MTPPDRLWLNDVIPARHIGAAVTPATDLIVETANPGLLDQTVQQLGTAVVVDGSFNGSTCRVRVFGDPGYIKFALAQQGYGNVIGEEPVS